MFASAEALADGPGRPIDPNGSLHVSALIIPPSDFWSSEFKAAYLRFLEMVLAHPDITHVPARDAPKAEWDKLDSDLDRLVLTERLAWDRKHYPVRVEDTQIGGVHVGIISP